MAPHIQQLFGIIFSFLCFELYQMTGLLEENYEWILHIFGQLCKIKSQLSYLCKETSKLHFSPLRKGLYFFLISQQARQ